MLSVSQYRESVIKQVSIKSNGVRTHPREAGVSELAQSAAPCLLQ